MRASILTGPEGPSPAAPPPAVAQAITRALRGPPGRIVLRVEEPAPHRRRVARALLQEGALAAGGQVLDGAPGDLLLIGAEAARAQRLCSLVERLVGPAATLVWSLDRDGPALLDYAAGRGAAAPSLAPDGPGLAALDGFLDAMPLSRAIRRRRGLAIGEGAAQPAFLRLEPDTTAIAAAMGALGADADLLEHARRRLAIRLLAALADMTEARALLGPHRPARLHLLLPAGISPGPAPPGRLVATLPLASAADPPGLCQRLAALSAAGIAAELDGLDAAALALLDLAALPPMLLRLRWSPALAVAPARRALRRLDPARLVLAEADEDALRFAGAAGIRLIEAPA